MVVQLVDVVYRFHRHQVVDYCSVYRPTICPAPASPPFQPPFRICILLVIIYLIQFVDTLFGLKCIFAWIEWDTFNIMSACGVLVCRVPFDTSSGGCMPLAHTDDPFTLETQFSIDISCSSECKILCVCP